MDAFGSGASTKKTRAPRTPPTEFIGAGCGPPNINRQLSEMKQSVAQSAIRAPHNDRRGKH